MNILTENVYLNQVIVMALSVLAAIAFCLVLYVIKHSYRAYKAKKLIEMRRLEYARKHGRRKPIRRIL